MPGEDLLTLNVTQNIVGTFTNAFGAEIYLGLFFLGFIAYLFVRTRMDRIGIMAFGVLSTGILARLSYIPEWIFFAAVIAAGGMLTLSILRGGGAEN